MLAPRGTKTVYRTCGAKKEQITTGERFNYNPLEGAVDGAYFGRSSNGWITTELFYGWVANHFTPRLGHDRPVVLLFDKHSDLETTKRMMSCFIVYLPHSSHITQPLDVGFFKPLKINWANAVGDFRCSHIIGQQVTRHVFARIFKTAWINTVKVRTIVNGFAASGIYPVDESKASSSKGAPSKIFASDDMASDEVSSSTPSMLALSILEEQLDEATLTRTL